MYGTDRCFLRNLLRGPREASSITKRIGLPTTIPWSGGKEGGREGDRGGGERVGGERRGGKGGGGGGGGGGRERGGGGNIGERGGGEGREEAKEGAHDLMCILHNLSGL